MASAGAVDIATVYAATSADEISMTPADATPKPIRNTAMYSPCAPADTILRPSGLPSSTDSGYGTLTDASSKIFPPVPGNRSHKPATHRVVNEEIPEALRHRFSDLRELLTDGLTAFLRKKHKNDIGMITWRLKMIGEIHSSQSAVPCIVVLCNERVAGTVKKYFNKSKIKREYQPTFPSVDRVSYQLHVYPVPAKGLAAIDVYVGSDITTQGMGLCGRRISAAVGGITRTSTIGGIVKVKNRDGSTSFFATTAGHTFEPDDAMLSPSPVLSEDVVGQGFDSMGDDDDLESNSTTDSEDEAFVQDSEDYFELDMGDLEEYFRSQGDALERGKSEATTVAPPFRDQQHLGRVSHTSVQSFWKTEFDYDWALISVDENFALANRLVAHADFGDDSPNLRLLGTPWDLTQVSQLKCRDARPGQRFWVTTSHGLLFTDLQASAFFQSRHAERATEVFMLRVYATLGRSESEKMTNDASKRRRTNDYYEKGDSGCWVMDQTTLEVLGYVVGSDIFGELYVVPFQAALDDMKSQIQAETVTLPSANDLTSEPAIPPHWPVSLAQKMASASSKSRLNPKTGSTSHPDSGYGSMVSARPPSETFKKNA